MAEQIISPGVFTRENDLSFLPQGIGAIGAAIVGPTSKGPAFIPTVIRSFAEFERRFGPLRSDTYVPQTVREYLKNAGSVTVCRVLAGGGYTFKQSNIQPLGIIVGSGQGVAATQATGSLKIGAGFFVGAGSDGDEVQITVGTQEYRFIAADPAAIPASESPIFYVASGSSIGAAVTNLRTAINSAGIGVTVSSGSGGGEFDQLMISASSAGLTGNDITVETGSGGTISTDVLLGPGFATTTLGGAVGSEIAGGVLAGLLYPSKIGGLSDPSLDESVLSPVAGHVVSSSFGITINGNNVEGAGETFSSSLDPANDNYLFKYVGHSADNSKTSATAYAGMPGYAHLEFKKFLETTLATGNNDNTSYTGIGSGSVVQLALMSTTDCVFNELSNTEGYSYSSTPFIHSQIALGRKDLFKFHTLDHGRLAKDYKISIANFKEPGDIDGVEQYSQFSVILRKGNDTDKTPNVLEQYNNVTLDPNSVNYICRRIGDRYPEYNETLDKVELKGNYPNVSNYIRVEVSQPVSERSISPKLTPKGFGAIQNPFRTQSLNLNCTIPSASYESIQQTGTDGVYSNKGYLGFKFPDKAPDNDNFLLLLFIILML